MSGMKSAAPRGAIAESRLQDHLGPYHDTGSTMPRRPPNAALPQSSWSVPSRPTLARRHGTQRRCRHGGRSYLGIIQRLLVPDR
eukprot:scaffold77691_cov61-Phaeocystis_antarctica.AAC.1